MPSFSPEYSFEVRKVARGSRRQFGQLSSMSFQAMGEFFHSNLRDRRFTREHANSAGYTERKESYQRKKMRMFRHNRPLEFTGESRARARVAKIKSSAMRGEVRYPGLRKFNFRNPHSSINMHQEFVTILNREERSLVRRYDQKLDQLLDTYGFDLTRRGSLRAPS